MMADGHIPRRGAPPGRVISLDVFFRVTRAWSRVVLLSVFALQALLLGCEGSTRTRTQLVLVADTDMAELDEVSFEVTPPAGDPQNARGAIAVGSPAFVVLAHESDAPLGPYHVSVLGKAAGTALISRTASLSFVSGQTRTALLHLVRACVHVTCPEGLVCAHDASCRAEQLEADELQPWSGQPPSLVSNGDADAGLGEDAEPPDAAVDAGDGGDPGCTPTCEGNKERVCEQGVLSAPRPCDTKDLCSTPACEVGMGCVRRPVPDGKGCGANGLTCQGGVCGAGQACADDCNPACNAGVLSCNLDCGATEGNCKPNCVGGASCDVACAGTSNCEVGCGGKCAVRCGDASNCIVTCRAGSSCDIDCRDDTDCKKTKCEGTAVCVLRCGANDSCGFESCAGMVPPVACGGGVFVCHGSCPAL